jgi:hypothetical protein
MYFLSSFGASPIGAACRCLHPLEPRRSHSASPSGTRPSCRARRGRGSDRRVPSGIASTRSTIWAGRLRLDRQARWRASRARRPAPRAGACSRGSPVTVPTVERGCARWSSARSRWPGQALDAVHVRLLHELQELPRIGGEALDVATLALGVDGVEARLDLPEPDRPVSTTSLPRGRSRSRDFRLCWRAPRIRIRSAPR